MTSTTTRVRPRRSWATSATKWRIVGVGDFNGDHTSDILWRRADGTIQVFDVDHNQVSSVHIMGSVGNEWQVAGVGDFNGDGTSDILWQGVDGTIRAYYVTDNQVVGTQVVGNAGNESYVAGVSDGGANGASDILLGHGDVVEQIDAMQMQQISDHVGGHYLV